MCGLGNFRVSGQMIMKEVTLKLRTRLTDTAASERWRERGTDPQYSKHKQQHERSCLRAEERGSRDREKLGEARDLLVSNMKEILSFLLEIY